ncbi:MAG TPA: tyrosine-type recombinase/integrase [Pirellulales bacterium]|jgi:integrase|nr:tyrosine-type recombinase/integrase [Pirellulales bacterium]
MEGIKVRVVEFGDRKCYQMQYVDPVTQKKKTRSTEIERDGSKKARTAAEKAAGKWEAELREGRYCDPSKTTWAQFRQRYEDEVLTGLAGGTDEKVSGVFNLLERIVAPGRLRDVTAARLSHFQAKLREEGRAESTIAGYMAHMKASLRWAVRMGLIPKAPEICRVRRAKGSNVMKGRPITGEEFDRLLGTVKAVVGSASAPSWKHYLRGLWLSGLRLTESLNLSWDDESKLLIDLSGKYAMLRIPAELEKGHKDRLLPIAPEFSEFLLATPLADRTGFVFKPKRWANDLRPSREFAIRTISKIGATAKVVVATVEKKGKAATKYASAHDLRRSFGERWATRVMPQVLKELMRHETIETTLRYYVGRNAQTTAAVLWEAHAKSQAGNTPSNIARSGKAANRRK